MSHCQSGEVGVTYNPIPYSHPAPAPGIENNRSGALIGFGVGSIVFGAIAGCGALSIVMAFGMTMGFGVGKTLALSDLIVALVMYAGMATPFLWVGVDSIRCRRWVRPVVIAGGWITIFSIIFALAFLLVAAKDFAILMSGSSQTTVVTPARGGKGVTVVTSPGASSGFESTIAFWTMLGTSLIGLLIAGAYVWFYSTAAVRRTLEAYNPEPAWTERCPLPVFVACAALLLAGLSTLASAVGGAAPFFGMYLKGPAAIGLDLGAAGLLLVAMVLMYRMDRAGWSIALVVVSLGFVSAALSLWRLGALEFYRHGHATAADLDRLAQSSVMSGVTPLVFTVTMGLVCVGNLVWVRRFFRGGAKV
jgi:hypothetical protein